MSSNLRQGVVVGNHGRHCLVQDTESGNRAICHARGKKSQAVVGDRVNWLPSQDEGTIESIVPRRNLLYRSDELRTKSFAANLDIVLIWIAAEPVFSEAQLTRALIACEDAGVRPIVVLNKSDLTEPYATAWARLAPYRAMGYAVIGGGLKAEGRGPHLARLKSELDGKTTLVLGPSGSGKSTLINALLPDAAVQTNSISTALNSGKHTTTSTTWYDLNPDAAASGISGAIIDSPGFQEFGLHHIAPTALAGLMPDLRAHAGECRFYNCTHLHEPGCGVRTALMTENAVFDEESVAGRGKISLNRYSLYSGLHAELGEKRY